MPRPGRRHRGRCASEVGSGWDGLWRGSAPAGVLMGWLIMVTLVPVPLVSNWTDSVSARISSRPRPRKPRSAAGGCQRPPSDTLITARPVPSRPYSKVASSRMSGLARVRRVGVLGGVGDGLAGGQYQVVGLVAGPAPVGQPPPQRLSRAGLGTVVRRQPLL